MKKDEASERKYSDASVIKINNHRLISTSDSIGNDNFQLE